VTRSWFLPAALADVEAAFRWYEAQQPGLGQAFVQAVDAAIARVLEFPDACPAGHRDARRYLVERFPHCLYYRIEGDGVIVVTLMHAAKDPERHGRRLRG
jgi:plasmid stabilization system protein ParE